MRQQPEADGKYTEEQLNKIWQAKGSFRSALRSDIQLLYKEEVNTLRDD
ncbi:MAG: hypothetical protein HC886_11950 [Leptolyngbyaceae cyanobacterium SM1_1_3]|nr:hypothetical protein [Leptolyngbyaceae cyanobacterium SM1_1_3]NJN03386.1 hypothetical protein [Leptolyngbyaceae cyanobacterium RM1_1_2]NJO10441.1 hypothetical protein [Leptolyngbyaceae cyanobacterium SL_1_1]